MRTVLIEARVHGRVMVRETSPARGLLIGFHGYMENAEIQMSRLESIPGAESWTLVSVQGLHRFYRGRSQDVVAGWMTRQDREAAIEDNIDYVNRVLAAIDVTRTPIVFTGFSQGVAMAFRAAVRGSAEAAGVIAVAGDVPPDLLTDVSRPFPPRILLARGERDEWYTDEKLQADVTALTSRGVVPQMLLYQSGHEWTPEVSDAAGRFLGASPRP